MRGITIRRAAPYVLEFLLVGGVLLVIVVVFLLG